MSISATTRDALAARSLPTTCDPGRVRAFYSAAGVKRKVWFAENGGKCVATTLASESLAFQRRGTLPTDSEAVVVDGGWDAAPEAAAQLLVKMYDAGTYDKTRTQPTNGGAR